MKKLSNGGLIPGDNYSPEDILFRSKMEKRFMERIKEMLNSTDKKDITCVIPLKDAKTNE